MNRVLKDSDVEENVAAAIIQAALVEITTVLGRPG